MRFAVVAVPLFLSAIGLGYTYNQNSSAPTFMTAPVERGDIATAIKASGTVEAVVTVNVSSQLSGRIANVFVDFNEAVKAGQPIAQLDRESFTARVNEARAALSVAQANAQMQEAALERAKIAVLNAQTAKSLVEAVFGANRDGLQVRMKQQAIAITEAERKMAEANVNNALAVVQQKEAELDQAQVDLDRTVIRAPIDGVVIKRDVNPGQTVAVSLDAKTLFKIANDLREMEVHGKIDEADVGELKVGQTAEFTVDAYPDQTFTGKVLQIRKSPEVEQNVVTYTTIVSASNPDLLLLPGMTAQLRIVVSDARNLLKIPNQALRFRPSGAGPRVERENANQATSSGTPATIWLVGKDGQPKPVAVRVGVSDETSTALLESPLQEGQQVITGTAHSQKPADYFGIRLGF